MSQSWVFLLLPVLLGSMAVLQGAINRHIGDHIGLAQATMLSNLMIIIPSALLYYVARFHPQLLPEMFHVKASWHSFKWWYIIPMLFGIFLVSCIPYAISELGAVKVTVIMIGAQVITSCAWDALVENIPLTGLKLGGIVCALLSVVLMGL
jgi:transporter family-2 protein